MTDTSAELVEAVPLGAVADGRTCQALRARIEELERELDLATGYIETLQRRMIALGVLDPEYGP